ncbi:MAG: hypothetical protein H6Q74_1215 [Firmicutes bacterium]|nr:hypothetical protein [Bacillota bacterium]
MDPLPTHRLLVVDDISKAILLVSNPSGKIVAEQPLPHGFSLVDITVNYDLNEAYLALAGNGGSGLLASFSLNTLVCSNEFAIPHPAQFTRLPTSHTFILADPDGHLYLTSAAKEPIVLDKPDGAGCCVGLVATESLIYGVWEAIGGGVLGMFDITGHQLYKRFFGATPTNLIADQHGRLFIPFTISPFSGEGLVVLSCQALDDFSNTIITQCQHCSATAPVYPIHVVITASGNTAYIANEEAGHINIVDLQARHTVGIISLGQSVSRLGLLPGENFAIASSNMFANLCLIDLVNKRLVAFTDERETLSPFAVIA